MGPTWGPPGSSRPQTGPMLAPWTLLSGYAKFYWDQLCNLGIVHCLHNSAIITMNECNSSSYLLKQEHQTTAVGPITTEYTYVIEDNWHFKKYLSTNTLVRVIFRFCNMQCSWMLFQVKDNNKLFINFRIDAYSTKGILCVQHILEVVLDGTFAYFEGLYWKCFTLNLLP